jgi:hypothetical protein
MSAVSLDLQAEETSVAALPSVSTGMMELPTFLRLFQLRKSQVMWFLGAGASRAAGGKNRWRYDLGIQTEALLLGKEGATFLHYRSRRSVCTA